MDQFYSLVIDEGKDFYNIACMIQDVISNIEVVKYLTIAIYMLAFVVTRDFFSG